MCFVRITMRDRISFSRHFVTQKDTAICQVMSAFDNHVCIRACTKMSNCPIARSRHLPPYPKEFTDTLRTPILGQGVNSVGTRSRHSSKSRRWFGLSKLRLGNIMARSTDRIAFSNPASPAQPSKWPMLVLTLCELMSVNGNSICLNHLHR